MKIFAGINIAKLRALDYVNPDLDLLDQAPKAFFKVYIARMQAFDKESGDSTGMELISQLLDIETAKHLNNYIELKKHQNNYYSLDLDFLISLIRFHRPYNDTNKKLENTFNFIQRHPKSILLTPEQALKQDKKLLKQYFEHYINVNYAEALIDLEDNSTCKEATFSENLPYFIGFQMISLIEMLKLAWHNKVQDPNLQPFYATVFAEIKACAQRLLDIDEPQVEHATTLIFSSSIEKTQPTKSKMGYTSHKLLV